MELSDVLEKIVNKNVPVSIHYGVVQSYSSGPKTISLTLAGGTDTLTGVRHLSSYASPTTSDVVIVLINRKDMVVLGKLA